MVLWIFVTRTRSLTLLGKVGGTKGGMERALTRDVQSNNRCVNLVPGTRI